MKRFLSLAALSFALLLSGASAQTTKTLAELDPLTTVADGDIVPVWDISAGTTSKTRGVLFSNFRTSLGLAALYQPLDADLTLFAAITPSANVQTLLSAASYAAFRTSLGLVIGTNVQAYDADLTTWAGITPSANVQTLLSSADYAAFRTSLALVIGTNVQAYDSDLTTYAGITPSANVQSLLAAANYAAMRTLLGVSTGAGDLVAANNLSDLASAATARTNLGLVIGTNVQAFDADLSLFAAITPAANVQSLLGAANYAAMRTLLSLGSVDNTADSAKPVSTAQQTALDAKGPVPVVSAISYGATITPAAGTVGAKIVHNIGALTGNPAIAAPSGTPVDGQFLELRFAQDATGGRVPTFNAIYSGVPPILPTAASAVFDLLFEYKAGLAVWKYRGGDGVPNLRVLSPTYGTTTTVASDTTDFATITATGNITTLTISGTPGEGQPLTLAITASGADRAVTLAGANYIIPSASGVTSPVTVLSGTETLFVLRWKATAGKWRVVSIVPGY